MWDPADIERDALSRTKNTCTKLLNPDPQEGSQMLRHKPDSDQNTNTTYNKDPRGMMSGPGGKSSGSEHQTKTRAQATTQLIVFSPFRMP